jgi:hypothetical protein
MRRLVVILMVTTMLAACGGAAATPSPVSSAAPSAAPSSPTAPPSAAPTDSLSASSGPSSSSPSGSSAFVLAGLVSAIPTTGGPPAASTFETTFASEIPAIYVAYQLAPGLSGKVTSTWGSAGAGGTIVATFDYPASAPWAYFRLTFQNGFIPGNHQEVLTVEATGQSVTLPFTITGPRTAPATPTPLPSGTSAFSLLRTATAADASKSAPDPSTYTDSFATTASAIFVVFSLRSGLTGTVTCSMTANGTAFIQPLSLDYGAGNSWGDFQINPSGTFPAGAYVATVTFTPTGDTETFNFTVN